MAFLMPITTQEITDNIDAMWTAYEPTITAREAAYFALNGRYFQGLFTHDPIPANDTKTQDDPTEEAPNNIDPTDKPTDQTEPWPASDFPPLMPAAFRLDPYRNDDGFGYAAKMTVEIDGDRWERSVNYGNDDSQGYAWTIIVPIFTP